MSEAVIALPKGAPPGAPAATASPASGVTELKVSGHLMTLDSGLFCIVQTPSATRASDGTGLPGVRITASPGDAPGTEAIRIPTFAMTAGSVRRMPRWSASLLRRRRSW
jgi:hypothetical protein